MSRRSFPTPPGPAAPPRRTALAASLIVVLGLLAPGPLDIAAVAQDNGAVSTVAKPIADETAVRRLVERWLQALEEGDLEQAFALWSERAPDRRLARLLLDNRQRDSRTVLDARIRRIDVDGDRARARVSLPERDADGTGDVAERHLDLVREQGVWRIWREQSAAASVVEALDAAAGVDAKQKALERERDLWSLSLFGQVAQRGSGAYVGGNLEEALGWFLAALRIAEAIGNAEARAAAWYDVGNVHYLSGRLPEAASAYETSLALGRDAGDRAGSAQALLGLGTIAFARADYPQARSRFEERLDLVRALGDRAAEATTLNNLGDVLYWLGDYRTALRRYASALPMLEALGQLPDVARARAGMATVSAAQGDARLALHHYEAALALYTQWNDVAARARIFAGMGQAAYQHGWLDRARAHFDASLALEKSLQSPAGIAAVLASLAVVEATGGRYADAVATYERSVPFFEAAGDPRGAAGAVLGSGLMHAAMGQHDDALSIYARAFARFQTLDDGDGMARTQLGRALVHLTAGRPGEARDAAVASLRLARRVDQPDTSWRAGVALGRALTALREWPAAHLVLGQAIDVWETLRLDYGPSRHHTGPSEEGVEPYDALAVTLADMGRAEEALEVAGKGRLRQIAETLGRHAIEIAPGLEEEEAARERGLLGELSTLRTQLDRARRAAARQPRDKAEPAGDSVPATDPVRRLRSLLDQARADYLAFAGNLYERRPDLRALRAEGDVVAASELPELIPPGTALLSFVVSADRVLVFAYARGALRVHQVRIDEHQLTAVVQRYRQAVVSRQPEAHRQASELYRALLAPLDESLNGCSRLLIVPDGILWTLPFETLVRPDGRRLALDVDVGLLPALEALRFPPWASPPTGGHGVTVRHPALHPEVLALLRDLGAPDALQAAPPAEASDEDGGATLLLSGADATARGVREQAAGASAILLDLPVLIDDFAPLFSFAALSPEAGARTPGTGLLPAWEWTSLPLAGSTLVLPRAHVRVGTDREGRGPLGVCWAALVAGARATIAYAMDVDGARRLGTSIATALTTHDPDADPVSVTAHARRAMLQSGEALDAATWAGWTVCGR